MIESVGGNYISISDYNSLAEVHIQNYVTNLKTKKRLVWKIKIMNVFTGVVSVKSKSYQ